VSELPIGASAFTAARREGSFYSAGMKAADYLTFYSTKFNTVEIDSTFHRAPASKTVKGWADKVPKVSGVLVRDSLVQTRPLT